MTSSDEISLKIAAISEILASESGATIFLSEACDSELLDGLMNLLNGNLTPIIKVEIGAQYMDYIAPLIETEDGDTVVLDGVQNIDQTLIDDLLRLVSDRVLVGVIGEGSDARSFEVPVNKFNLIIVERGSVENSVIRAAAECNASLSQGSELSNILGSHSSCAGQKINEVIMKIELELIYRNGDNGESDEQNILVETDNENVILMAVRCASNPSAEELTAFFKSIYDNPYLSGSGADQNGYLYDKLWPLMSEWAFNKLGWHDVTVDVVGISIDNESIHIDIYNIDTSDWALQIVRDEGMYCYN